MVDQRTYEVAETLIRQALDGDQARVDLSPVLRGPVSKGELTVFYEQSTTSRPERLTLTGPWEVTQTVTYVVSILLRDLNNVYSAVTLMQNAKAALTGLQVLAPGASALYDRGLYPVSDAFTELASTGYWVYALRLQCQRLDTLPSPRGQDSSAGDQALILEALSDYDGRINLSPVLQGPLGKSEVNIFYESSDRDAPDRLSFNGPIEQIETQRFRASIVIKDLNDVRTALFSLSDLKDRLTGLQLAGPQANALYDGGLYPVSDAFSELDSEGYWVYDLVMEHQSVETLPGPRYISLFAKAIFDGLKAVNTGLVKAVELN